MSDRGRNVQLFALPGPPPRQISVGPGRYRLLRVFKHDFFAATAQYQAIAPARPERIVVKLYRTQRFCGLPMAWAGRLSRDHEMGIYAALAGVPGVPRLVGPVGRTGLAVEHIDAVPLDHLPSPPAGYFDRMRAVLDGVHRRGVAHVDANKRSNMLVGPGGEAYLVDYQIAIRRRDDLPWPLRGVLARLVKYFQGKDLYHLYKQKRRLAPQELTDAEDTLSRQRSGWHRLHRTLTKPYRAIRRRFLRRQYRSGRLVSPSAQWEDQHQPEKDTWQQ